MLRVNIVGAGYKPDSTIILPIICFLIYLSCTQFLFAQQNSEYLPINAEADAIVYSQDQRSMEASGNVVVTYEDYVITANRLSVDLVQKKARFSDGFSFMRNQRAITGRELFYDLEKHEGKAENVTLHMDGMIIKGKTVEIIEEKVILRNSVITTCDLEHPHYKVTAMDTTLYLKWGLLVSGSSIFWLSDVPVMYIPNYIVGDPLYGMDTFENAPLPRIGSDQVNGTYVKERINTYADEQGSGTAAVEWYEKNGWLFGFRHDWRYSRTSFGNIRLHYHTVEGLEGGITHRFLLTREKDQRQSLNIIEQFFDIVPFDYTPFLEAQFDLTSGEIYNDDRDQQRVSFLPQITLTIPWQPSLVPQIDHEMVFQIGNILEEGLADKKNSINRIRSLFSQMYKWSKYTFWDVNIGLQSGYTGRWYWNRSGLTDSWNVINGELTLDRIFSPFYARWGYYHNFINIGSSAFSYDSKEAVVDDEIRYKLSVDLGSNTLAGEWRYNLPQEYYRDIDVSFKLNIHCWNLVLTWREVRREFNVGVSLN
ncbi:MAG: hypothetical protein ABIH39_00465 [Candidatus Margulisiibacteriota bacterium]